MTPLAAYRRHQERRGFSGSYIAGSRSYLLSFARSIAPRDLLEATREDVEAFLDPRLGNVRTYYVNLSRLRMFFRWAHEEELIDADPTARIVSPRLPRLLPRPMAEADLSRALAEADPEMRAILLLAGYAGLRVKEIGGIQREDVLEGEGLLRVTVTKGGSERLVPLHDEVSRALRCLPMPRSGYLFRRPRKGDPWPPVKLSQKINDHLHACGIEASAHCLRHRFGTQVYGVSKDLRVTQELLGHAHPQSTAPYTKFSQARRQGGGSGPHVETRAETAPMSYQASPLDQWPSKSQKPVRVQSADRQTPRSL